MKKLTKGKLLLTAAGAFALAFVLCSAYDYFFLARSENAYPMTTYLAVRAAEFLLPGAVLLAGGLYRRSKEKNEERP
jgi:hypothetical protein